MEKRKLIITLQIKSSISYRFIKHLDCKRFLRAYVREGTEDFKFLILFK